MKVIADQDRCCGAGTCALLAPEVFDQREDDGIVTVLDETPGPDQHDAVLEAVSVCPTAAISAADS